MSLSIRIVTTLLALVFYSENVKCSDAVNCPAPRAPENGLTFIFNNGKVVRYRCHPGYMLQGAMRAICRENNWSKPAPKCIKGHSYAITQRREKLLTATTESTESDDTREEHGSNRLPIINGQWRQTGQTGYEALNVRPMVDYPSNQKQHASKKELIEQEVNIASVRDQQEKQIRMQRIGSRRGDTRSENTDSNQHWSHHQSHISGDTSQLNTLEHYTSTEASFDANRGDQDNSFGRSPLKGDTMEEDDDLDAAEERDTERFRAASRHSRRHSGEVTSRPLDYFGRRVQVLNGEKAAQMEDQLRRQFESVSRHRRPLLEEQRQRPIEYTYPQPDNREVASQNNAQVSRATDYWGRPVQQLTGEKAAQQEELLRRQFEMAQAHLIGNNQQEARGREPSVVYPPQNFERRPQYEPTPDRSRGDGEVTSPPLDYWGRPVQVLSGHKAAQATEQMRRQYEEYNQRNRGGGAGYYDTSRRLVSQNTSTSAVDTTDEDRRRYYYSQRGGSSSGDETETTERRRDFLVEDRTEDRFQEHRAPPVEYVRRHALPAKGVDVPRKNWEQAVRTEEFRRRPVEYVQMDQPATTEEPVGETRVHRHHRRHHHHSHHKHHPNSKETFDNENNITSSSASTESGENKPLKLSERDIELLNKLSPEMQDLYLKDLRRSRHKEETSPKLANQFMDRYKRTWKTRKAAAKSSQEENSVPTETSTQSSEDNSSETSTERNIKSTYDDSCLQDLTTKRELLRAPRIANAFIFKYERKKLSKPPFGNYVLVRYKCRSGYELLFEKSDALYCRERNWIGERPICVKNDKD